MLNGVFQYCWREFHSLTQNEQPSKNPGTWSVSCYIMGFYFRRPKDNKQLLRAKSFCKFLILIETWKSCSMGQEEGQKQGFLNLLKDLVINLYWICSIMKTYSLLCSCTIPIFGKIFVPEIWANQNCRNF